MNGTKLTLVFSLRTEPAIERAVALIERWVCDELDIEGPLRAISVASVRISGEGLPVPESGARLAERRNALRLTQQGVARMAGIGRSAVAAVERGQLGAMSGSTIAVRRALAAAEAAQ